MSKTNPFTVPETYFEDARRQILQSTARIRRRRKVAGGILASLILLAVILPGTLSSRKTKILEDEAYYTSILNEYHYDYFLQLCD